MGIAIGIHVVIALGTYVYDKLKEKENLIENMNDFKKNVKLNLKVLKIKLKSKNTKRNLKLIEKRLKKVNLLILLLLVPFIEEFCSN